MASQTLKEASVTCFSPDNHGIITVYRNVLKTFQITISMSGVPGIRNRLCHLGSGGKNIRYYDPVSINPH